jgi:protein CpxP
MNKLSLAPLAASLVLAIPAIGAAQPAPPPPPPPGGMQPHHDWEARRGEAMARHAKALHDVLGIRPDQEAAFQAFVAARHRPMGDHMRPEPRPDLSSLPMPDRLEQRSKMMEAHEAMRHERMQQMIAAVRGLYGVLSPEQRRTFDALPSLMGHGEMGHDGMRNGGKLHGPGEREMGPPPQ